MKLRIRFNVRKITLALCFGLPGLSGCSNTMDILSSQRFKDAPFHTIFYSDDPVELMKKSEIADYRSKAFLLVKEPKPNGGTEAEQNELFEILAAAATTDKQPICRLRAIEALGRWEDPRAAQILMTAYQNAANEAPGDKQNLNPGVVQAGRRTRTMGQVSSYTSETIITIRCRALEALGKKRTPEGMNLLCELASTPPKREAKPTELEFGGSVNNNAQDHADLRLAAIRALANFTGEMKAAQVVYKVMTTEHDVALKSRSYDSLQKITGKEFAPDSAEWATHLQLEGATPPIAPTPAVKRRS